MIVIRMCIMVVGSASSLPPNMQNEQKCYTEDGRQQVPVDSIHRQR